MKKNLSEFAPLLFGAGLVLLGGGLGWMAFSSWSSALLVAEELFQRRQGSVLVAPGGMEKLNQDIALLQKSRTQLEKELQALVQPGEEAWGAGEPWSVDPGQWKDRLIEANDRIRKESGASGQSEKLVLSPEFYLGFEEYRQKSPSPQEVPDLARQLAVSQRLADHLLASRREVSEPFPTPCVLTAWKVPAGRMSSPDDSAAGQKTKKDPAQPPNSQIQVRETYEITLECSPEILADLLRRLARDPWLFIPTSLVVENEQASFPKRAEFEKIFSQSQSAEAPSSRTEGTSSSVKPPLLLVLAGKEKLKVSLTVDFVGWPPAAAAVSPAPGSPKEGT